MATKSEYITVNIQKPIWYGDGICEVGIRDKFIWKAKREKKKLRIVVPQGEVIMSVREFLKEAILRPKVFLFKDRPMGLFYRRIRLQKKRTVEDFTIPLSVKERLREVWIERNL